MNRRPKRYTERISFTLPVGQKAELKRKAAFLGISMSELVRHIALAPDQDEILETMQ